MFKDILKSNFLLLKLKLRLKSRVIATIRSAGLEDIAKKIYYGYIFKEDNLSSLSKGYTHNLSNLSASERMTYNKLKSSLKNKNKK